MKTLRIAGKINDSITDGIGFRKTVFVQGCPHHCPGCHNSETWDYSDDKGFDISLDEILQEFDSNPILAGITISGGEPLSERNLDSLFDLVQEIKVKRKKSVWIYTGYTIEYLLEHNKDRILPILTYVDVLVDGPFVESLRDLTLQFRGSSNQRLIDIQEFLKTGLICDYLTKSVI